MKLERVLNYLCYYDSRNPYGSQDKETQSLNKAKEDCTCHNCFYSYSDLAEEILRLKQIKP